MFRRVVTLSHCGVEGNNKSDILAFVEYMECVSPLNDSNEALGCVCLR